MDFNIEVRKKQLENLEQLVSSSKKRVQSVLSYLGWSEENVQKGQPLVQCPINPHHRICPKSWTEHIAKCLIKIEGYDQKTQFLSESVDGPRQSIYIDHNKKIEIITKELTERGPLRLAWNGLDPDPRTADRWITTYSPDERLIFYNYCVENTAGPSTPPEFTTIVNKKQDEEKPLSYEEILAQQRDAKRRRAKYKSVHINRKNHTEVIREVINGQMEEYKEWLSAKQESKTSEKASENNGVEEEKKEEDRPHSSISRTSNHSNSSRSTNRKYKDRRESSKERYHKSRRSRSNERKDKRDERHSEDRRNWNNHSKDRRRSRERDRHYSKDRNRRYHDNGRRH